MNTLRFNDADIEKCRKAYLKLDPEQRLTMSHFDLAEQTDIKDLALWVKFLKEPSIKDKINEELEIYIAAQQRKLISLATDKSQSTGMAQLIAALDKAQDRQETTQSGPAFVYMFVPPNENEKEVPNMQEVKIDPFKDRAMFDNFTPEIDI